MNLQNKPLNIREWSISDKLIIDYQNDNVLQTKFDIIAQNVKLFTPSPDIIVLGETGLYPGIKYSLCGYNVFKRDRHDFLNVLYFCSTYLFNLFVQISCLPLGKTFINRLFKSDNKQDILNYRPIAIIGPTSQWFDSIMPKMLTDLCI